jgi:hypothetical protein
VLVPSKLRSAEHDSPCLKPWYKWLLGVVRRSVESNLKKVDLYSFCSFMFPSLSLSSLLSAIKSNLPFLLSHLLPFSPFCQITSFSWGSLSSPPPTSLLPLPSLLCCKTLFLLSLLPIPFSLFATLYCQITNFSWRSVLLPTLPYPSPPPSGRVNDLPLVPCEYCMVTVREFTSTKEQSGRSSTYALEKW